MTSKLVVNTIEADTGISSVSFASSISLSSTSKFHFSAAGIDIDADTNINRPAAGVIGFNINSSEKARINSSGEIISNNGTLRRNVSDSSFTVSGDTASNTGANINLYGASHGSLANVFRVRTGSTERLRIDSSGNVNIGVNGSSNPFTYLRFGGSQYGAADIRPTNEGSHKIGLAFYVDGTQDTTINPTEKVRIDSSGYLIAKGDIRLRRTASDNGAVYFGDTNNNYIFGSDADDLITFATANTERLRIGSTGKLTFDYDAAENNLADIDFRTNAGLQIRGFDGNANNAKLYLGGSNLNQRKTAIIHDPVGGYCRGNLHFCFENTADTSDVDVTDSRMVITPSGNMKLSDPGVTFSDSSPYFPVAWSGTDGANTTFTIASTGYANLRFRGEQTSGTEYTMGVGAGIFYMAYDDINNGHRITVAANGVVSLNVNDTSDEKMKKNITSLADGAISRIKQLRPVNFDWKKDSDLNGQSGFIAQEIKTVIPDLVQGEEYVEGNIESVGYSVNTTGIVAHLTKALQEAITKIETLETKVAALEGS